jgi:hypothetical protein
MNAQIGAHSSNTLLAPAQAEHLSEAETPSSRRLGFLRTSPT